MRARRWKAALAATAMVRATIPALISKGGPGRRLTALGLVVALLALGLTVSSSGASLALLKPNPTDVATFVGHGGYSADGLGQIGSGGTVQAEVPAGSTVVRAYLYGSYFFTTDPSLEDRNIDFDGTVVELTKIGEVGYLSTARADVTAQVAAEVGSGGGITDFAVNSDPSSLDGVGLVVIYSNPAEPETTIAVLDGGASQAGDTATFNFAAPLDKTVPGFSATMSVGSGFSYQGAPGPACGGGQFSVLTVNSQLLSNCAGNYDDGLPENGALITVGGVGDSTDNPTPADNPAEDDELYDLSPFLNQGDTSVEIATSNPSQDDNLFLAVIAITARAQVTTEICDNGIDDDGDLLIDGDDPDCAPVIVPTTTTYTGSASVQYSDSAALSGTLTDSAAAGIAGKTLDFTLGSQSTSAGPTDGSGSASTGLVVTQQPGSVTQVDTSFAGDATHAASADSDPFAILKEDCTLTYSGDTTVLPLANTNLAADLGELDTSLGDLSGKTVTFTVVDSSLVSQTFDAVTDAAGHAATSQPLAANVYAVTVAFAGDDFYNPCATSTETLVTVQAAGSKVTGGGWYVAGSNAHFGLNLIPQAGGLWKGQFQLRVTNTKAKFHGNTAANAVSLAPNKVRWTGTGRWNGVSGYTFEITVVDNGTSGKKGDTIDIKIYPTGSPGSPVYTSSGAKPLKGGNLVVHK